jgi:hypothetical protein
MGLGRLLGIGGGWMLGRNLGQNVHSSDLSGYAEIIAGALFHSQNSGVTTDPALLARGEFGRKYENQFHLRAFHHAGLGIEEHAIRADVASLGGEFSTSGGAANANRDGCNDSVAGTAINLRRH